MLFVVDRRGSIRVCAPFRLLIEDGFSTDYQHFATFLSADFAGLVRGLRVAPDWAGLRFLGARRHRSLDLEPPGSASKLAVFVGQRADSVGRAFVAVAVVLLRIGSTGRRLDASRQRFGRHRPFSRCGDCGRAAHGASSGFARASACRFRLWCRSSLRWRSGLALRVISRARRC